MTSPTNFILSVRQDRRYSRYAIAALVVSIFLLLIFKTFYPWPNLVMDSYYYLEAAAGNWDINAWPVGYSKFIRFFGFFTHSSWALVAFQYLFLEAVNLLFFFTLLYFYQPGKITRILLFLFLFVNPLFLYLSNLIMADSLFTALSILWVTQLLWILFRPRPWMLFTHALILFFAFTIRYNALYYPIVAVLALLLSRQRLVWRLVGIGLPFLLLGAFVWYTSGKLEQLSGERQFSPFGGWKVANDALFMYAHIPDNQRQPVPEKFKKLDKLTRRYFELSHDDGDLNRRDVFWGSNYMFQGYSPLVQYMLWQYPNDSNFINSPRWAKIAPLYGSYGSFLMRTYPVAYAQYFLWPNLQRYLLPTLEIFEAVTPFYLRPDDLGEAGRKWFGLTTLTVSPSLIQFRTMLFGWYQILLALVQLGFIAGILGFVAIKGWKSVSRPVLYSLLFIVLLWLANLAFSVFAAAIVFRYLVFILVISFPFCLIVCEWIYRPPAVTAGSAE